MTHPLRRRLLVATFIAFLFQLIPSFAVEPAPASITGPVVWKFATGKDVTAAPVIDHGVVYCGSTNGQFFALDVATGQQLWKFKARFPISCRAAVQGDTVCFESGNTLYALDRASGREKWQYVAKPFRPIFAMDLTDYHRSSPVIADGVVYFGDDWGNLNGVDLATGLLIFQFTTDAARPIRSSPAIKDGVVYFGDWEGDVFAVSLAEMHVLTMAPSYPNF
jgi:eukaryotic-like serine/threonine-protein kinase